MIRKSGHYEHARLDNARAGDGSNVDSVCNPSADGIMASETRCTPKTGSVEVVAGQSKGTAEPMAKRTKRKRHARTHRNAVDAIEQKSQVK